MRGKWFALLCAIGLIAALAATTARVSGAFSDTVSVSGNTITTSTAFPSYIQTGTYTGNGVNARVITGVNFQPNVVIIKSTTAQAGVARTSTMAGDASQDLTGTTGLTANLVESLNANGFTLGNDARVNGSATTYHWTAMRTGSDLSVGTYTGNGADNRNIAVPGSFQPVWLMLMGTGAGFRPATVTGDQTFWFTSPTAIADAIQSFNATGFQVGTLANTSAAVYHYVAWRASTKISQGSYTGNGADNRSITTPGWQPAFVWDKRVDTSQSRWRPSSLAGDNSLAFDATAQGSNRIQSLLATGFQVGTDAEVNTGAGAAATRVYHYLAQR